MTNTIGQSVVHKFLTDSYCNVRLPCLCTVIQGTGFVQLVLDSLMIIVRVIGLMTTTTTFYSFRYK